jgi:protocatechuate 3,4-dioxygenase alpha subunit
MSGSDQKKIKHAQGDEQRMTERLIATASQTVGPFFHLAGNMHLGCVARPRVDGSRIRLACRVIDGDGIPVPDALIELWQADANGNYGDPSFGGFGRLGSDENGFCVFETVRPGRVAGLNGALQAPHINLIVFARGLLKHLYTRVYFERDAENADDAVLATIPADRRETLLARAAGPDTWNFEIHLCGDRETVFFDI